MLVQNVTMEGRHVRLEPVAERHLAGLARAIQDGELWTNPYTFVPQLEHLPQFVHDAQQRLQEGIELAFAIIDRASGTVVGSSRFRNIVPQHRRLEIGFTFFARSWQRTYAHTESMYLMLRYAFDEWECERVEFLADDLNVQSRTAIARLGAIEEGLLRRHYVMRDGRVRDTAVFGIIRQDWEGVCAALERRLLDAASVVAQ
jgi:RimJ/RimL family protein N-acetyltransferase